MQRAIELILMFLCSLICSAQRITIDTPQYRSVFDTLLQVPAQVEWMVTKTDLGNAKRDPNWQFLTDTGYPGIHADHSDYTKTGYHRGHMCPAADRSRSAMLMQQTFMISNIAPQTPSVNTGAWKATENFVRRKIHEYDTLCIVAIPVFLNRDTSYLCHGKIAIPHAYIKAVWLPQSDSVIGCWFIFNK